MRLGNGCTMHGGTDPREAEYDQSDQRAVAKARERRGVDTVDQRACLHWRQHRRLSCLHRVRGAAHRSRRVHRHHGPVTCRPMVASHSPARLPAIDLVYHAHLGGASTTEKRRARSGAHRQGSSLPPPRGWAALGVRTVASVSVLGKIEGRDVSRPAARAASSASGSGFSAATATVDATAADKPPKPATPY
jgi:hypothetical protein